MYYLPLFFAIHGGKNVYHSTFCVTNFQMNVELHFRVPEIVSHRLEAATVVLGKGKGEVLAHFLQEWQEQIIYQM